MHSGSYSEPSLLFKEIAEFVRLAIEKESERFRSIPNKADHHGLFMSGCALFRLQTSFSTARFLLRQHYWIELACIEKLIFEQICWSYNVRHLQGSKLYAVSPTSAVKAFKNLYPDAGIIYGLLNDIAHISPRRSKDYLDFYGFSQANGEVRFFTVGPRGYVSSLLGIRLPRLSQTLSLYSSRERWRVTSQSKTEDADSNTTISAAA